MTIRTKNTASCHSRGGATITGDKKVTLVGNPNVGKSVVFGNLTGNYVTVSNYPGTTVEVTRGNGKINDKTIGIIDTPGMYSLLPITEEESVARAILLNENTDIVIQVADAKSLERTLHLTLQLIEFGLPVILDLNIMDEAGRLGMRIDLEKLRRELDIPVVSTVATDNKGMENLRQAITKTIKPSDKVFRYEDTIESAIIKIAGLIKGDYRISKRAMAVLLLQDDPDIRNLIEDEEAKTAIDEIALRIKQEFSEPLNYLITIRRQRIISKLAKDSTSTVGSAKISFRERLSRLIG
ncbi:MAG: GTP-binding protein [Planctomycetia bacterium]|nr:GTP-binding protein [Planctomycetia bacterium]